MIACQEAIDKNLEGPEGQPLSEILPKSRADDIIYAIGRQRGYLLWLIDLKSLKALLTSCVDENKQH